MTPGRWGLGAPSAPRPWSSPLCRVVLDRGVFAEREAGPGQVPRLTDWHVGQWHRCPHGPVGDRPPGAGRGCRAPAGPLCTEILTCATGHPVGSRGRSVSDGRAGLLPGPRAARAGKWHVRGRPAGPAGGEPQGSRIEAVGVGAVTRHRDSGRVWGRSLEVAGVQRQRRSGVLPTHALGGQTFPKRDRGPVHGVWFEARRVAPCARRASRRGSAGGRGARRTPAPRRECPAFPLSSVGRLEPGRGLRFQKAG